MTLLDDNTEIIDVTDPIVLDQDNPDYEMLQKRLNDKDEYILRLQRENAGIRQELNSRVREDEFIDRLNSNRPQELPSTAKPQAQPEQNTGRELTAESINRILDERERNKERNQNLDAVKNTLKDKLGPNYASKVRDSANQLGLSEAYITDLASTSPNAFLRLMGVDASSPQRVDVAPPRPSVNTEGFNRPSTSNKRNYAYFEEIRKQDPGKYWSPAIQNEMFREAQAQGDSFYKQ